MRSWIRAVLATLVLAWPATSLAHPAPFSYLDLHVSANRIDAILVAHIVDVAHELSVTPADLLEPSAAARYANAIAKLLQQRLDVTAGSQQLSATDWPSPELLADRQAWRWTFHFSTTRPATPLTVRAALFPYDGP